MPQDNNIGNSIGNSADNNTAAESPESNGPMLVMLLFMVAVQLLALALMPAIAGSDARVFEDPESTANPIIYVIFILGFTLFLLLAIRLKQGWVIGGFILLAVASSIYYMLLAFMSPLQALIPTLAVILLLRYYPEWYIVDAFGILVCAGISALFGVSMTTLPALLLLLVLAVYDAISVYKTRHMVSLAEGAIKMKAPLLFVVPKSRDYSFRKDQMAVSVKAKGDRGAYFLGLGDAIIPTILVISANLYLSAPAILGVNLPAIGAMIGTYAGFLVLMRTTRDRPQAGLPFLNSGAILGFLLGCALAGVRPF
ncbi:MAG TPA: presenilin family intramembrane aspartyl protease PSH [Methanotrichaceae archaeon]|nr:presenilin family intramembrane aspartyl protease PSH [Methanotrichaceae archaeon]